MCGGIFLIGKNSVIFVPSSVVFCPLREVAKFNWFIKKREETGSMILWQPLEWKVPNPDF